MKIVFNKAFYNSDYATDGASATGRLEAIMDKLVREKNFDFISPEPATEKDLLYAHSSQYVANIKQDSKRYNMAILSTGAAILASKLALNDEPSFACIRPPGHHASREDSWGYCTFSNMGIAILKLIAEQNIKSAFILDFDAHTGDGTKAVLAHCDEVKILNPYADTGKLYIKEIQDYLVNINQLDMVAVCAGFDSYEKDIGKKLSTFQFYEIGVIMKNFAKRVANGRRFSILEGGYYQPDLGKNVLAFCHGFQ